MNFTKMRDEILNTVEIDRYIERHTDIFLLPENVLVNYYLLKLRNYLVWGFGFVVCFFFFPD